MLLTFFFSPTMESRMKVTDIIHKLLASFNISNQHRIGQTNFKYLLKSFTIKKSAHLSALSFTSISKVFRIFKKKEVQQHP